MSTQSLEQTTLEGLKKLPEGEKHQDEKAGGLQVSQQRYDPVQMIKKGFRYFMKHIYDPAVIEGQHPKFLVFACSDSRVSPSHVLNFRPGEAFMVCNVANLVPAFNQLRYSGTGAAIEFSVKYLEVENILVIGHSLCGGIKRLMELPEDGSTSNDFIDDWVKIGLPAKAKVLAENPHLTHEQQCRICEREAVTLSLVNIQSYPYVRAAMAKGKLALMGGYYNFVEGNFELWQIKYHIQSPEIIRP